MTPEKFYLISQDLGYLLRHHLLQDGDEQTKNLPVQKILDRPRQLLRIGIEQLLPEFRLMIFEESDLRARLNALVDKNRAANLAVVSMDHYIDRPDFTLHVTRVSIPDAAEASGWKKIKTPRQRPNQPTVEEQVRSIATLAASTDKDVILADDGIWSAGTFEHIIDMFGRYNVKIVKIVAGVLAKKDKVPSHILERMDFLHAFSSDSMADWICERDFFIGSPFFGRTLGTGNGDHPDPRGIGIPYCRPLGDCDWASIDPARAQDFSHLCVNVSRMLFSELQNHLGRPILVGELQTMPLGAHEQPEKPIIDWLDQMASQL